MVVNLHSEVQQWWPSERRPPFLDPSLCTEALSLHALLFGTLLCACILYSFSYQSAWRMRLYHMLPSCLKQAPQAPEL